MNNSTKLIKADFHIHTSCSRRVTATPQEMYESAKAKGLDKIAITDHNTLRGALSLAEKDPDFIIIGEEITWDAPGEIIGLFLKEAIPEGKSAAYTLDALQEQDAFIFIPHPFAPFHFFCPPEYILKTAVRIDAIEIRNGRNYHLLNTFAAAFGSAAKLKGICGSDAHHQKDVGKAGMILPDFSNAEELRNSIQQASPFGTGLSVFSSLKLLKKVF